MASGVRRWSAAAELWLAVSAGALWYAQGGWVAYAGAGPGPWPLVLLALMWALRLIRSLPTAEGRAHLPPSPFALPFGLFLLSAGVGLQVAYDSGPAQAKWWLIVGAMGLYWAMAGQPDLKRLLEALGFWEVVGAGIAIFFLMTNDWATYPAALQPFARFARIAASSLPLRLATETLNPNVAAGILVLVFPLCVPLVVRLWAGPQRGTGNCMTCAQPTPRLRGLCLTIVAVVLGSVLLGCLMTFSWGAWLALALTAGLWAVWRLSKGSVWRTRLVAVALLTMFVALALCTASQELLSSRVDGIIGGIREVLANRIFLAKLGALLARDTFFTGIGLGMFEMHFSIYALLIHVGFVEHSHNLLVDMAIEQGLLGVGAYGTMVATALVIGVQELGRAGGSRDLPGSGWGFGSELRAADSRARTSHLRAAMSDCRLLIESALASLTAVFIHGLVDDPLYGSRAVLFLFVPFGILVAAIRASREVRAPLAVRTSDTVYRRATRSAHLLPLAIVIVLCTSLVVALIGTQGGPRAMWPRLQAAWHANAGVIAEARCELSVYDQEHFDDPTLDQVRRHLDLAEAVAHFEAALAHDPTQVTATQRLAAIALARGQYGDALQMMRDLWVSGHRDRVTRLLYGDALTAAGQVDEAVAAVQGVSFAKSRLLGQAWSRYHLDDDNQREIWARDAAEKLSD